ncbi:MAG: hypothetical protein ACLGGX_00135 [Bdellovibrionia bacterium]
MERRGIKRILEIFILFFLFACHVEAQPLQHKLEIQRNNRYGMNRVDVIEFHKTHIKVNSKKLNSVKAKRIAAKLLSNSKIKADAPYCSAGSFRIIKTSSGKKTIHAGCALGKDYGSFLADLYELHEVKQ